MKTRIVFALIILLVIVTLMIGCSQSTPISQTTPVISTGNVTTITTDNVTGSAEQALQPYIGDQFYTSSGAFLKVPVFGPTNINISTGFSDYAFPSITFGDRVGFSFSANGSLVNFSVLDPYGNIIIIGSGGNNVVSSAGSFIASSSGIYKLHFKSSGKAVITVSYSVVNILDGGNIGQLGGN